MKIIPVNIGETKTIQWRGKPVKTGIYKYPVEDPICLEKAFTKVNGNEYVLISIVALFFAVCFN